MNIKRCQSVDRIGPNNKTGAGGGGGGRPRYKGRFSLQQQPQMPQQNQQSTSASGGGGGGYGHPKARRRRFQMRRSPRRHRADLLDELDEICAENFRCLGSTDDQHQSSSPPILHSPYGPSQSSSDAETQNSPLSILPSRTHFRGDHSKAIGGKCRREGDLDVVEFLREEMDKFRRKKKMLARNAESEEEQRHKFGNVLWLHLRAYFDGRQMDAGHIRQSLGLQDRAIMKQREQKMGILSEIGAFKFVGALENAEMDEEELYGQIYGQSNAANRGKAVEEVSALLDKWEALAELFPHSMAMKKAVEAEMANQGQGDGIFKRVEILQAWLNITRMLMQKLNEVGLLFSQIEGRHRQSSLAAAPSDLPSPPIGPSSSPSAHSMAPHPPISSIWPWPELDPKSPVAHQLADLMHKILQRVVGRSLRLHGMIAVLRRLQSLTKLALEKACLFLLQPRKYSQIAGQNGLGNYVKKLREKFGAMEIAPSSSNWSTAAHLTDRQHFSALGLPSLRPHFLLLLQLPIQLVNVWLEMRSEKVASTEWDLLTLETLVEDSHDCLEESIRVKNDFLVMWNLISAGPNPSPGANPPNSLDPQSAELLAKFDGHLELVFHNFLSYTRLWAQTAAKFNGNGGIEWGEKIIGKMAAEWSLAQEWGQRVVPRGELDAARMFCAIGRDMLDLLVRRYLNEKFDCAELEVLETNECADAEDDFMLVDEAENIKTASSIFLLCRAFKEMIRQLRDRSLRSLAFIRQLSLCLEFCARFEWESAEGNCDALVDQLVAGGRHLVISFPADNANCNFLCVCVRELANQFEQIDRLLLCATAAAPGQAKSENEGKRRRQQQKMPMPPNYLLLIPSVWLNADASEFDEKIMMRPTMAAWRTLQHLIAPNNIYLVAGDRGQLQSAQRLLDSMFGQSSPSIPSSIGRLLLVDDFCSCNDELAEELCDLKRAAFECVREVWTCSRDLGEYVLNGKRLEDLVAGERASLKGTLLQAWSAVFECQKELSHVVSTRMHAEFFSDLLSSVQQWAAFISGSIGREACRAALDQLAILMGISKNIFESTRLTEGDLRQFMENVRMVTGHIQSLDNEADQQKNEIAASAQTTGIEDNQNAIDGHPDPAGIIPSDGLPADGTNPHHLENIFPFGTALRLQMPEMMRSAVEVRIKRGVEWVEARRQTKLQGQRRIGHVLGEKDRRLDLIKTHFFTPRKAPFEWQRLENSELGSGSFGSVFLAMNLRDKFLLAVKQVQVRHDNEPSLRAMIDEVEILRTLNHPNLVKYYGVEVHKTEVLIFMEYCSEGTLARLCREGMDLATTRRYTHSLFQSIAYIHEHGIVHRDIKTANIFLGAGEKLKLGDFGCSFRLDGTQTMAGEMLTYVGTVRYMAPEIQTNGVPGGEENQRERTGDTAATKGYGRAVDIWSGGCVVLEMLTGKKPFHYLNHEFQVIYQLGMGIAPKIPAEVQHNQMAHSFLRACFVIDAQQRPMAAQLLQHPFANILPQELAPLEI